MSEGGSTDVDAQAEAEALDRAGWIGELAHAEPKDLARFWAELGLTPEFTWLRAPEIGLIMARGRAGGEGAAFNLGEVAATRCALALPDGIEGHACALGRDKRKAEISALCDALLQTPAAPRIRSLVLGPLIAVRRARERRDAAAAARTKVEFFTLVRGEP